VVMIGLAFTQVILRNLPGFLDKLTSILPGTAWKASFNSEVFKIQPFTWADVVVRHLVLWVGFIGASVATKEDSHLAMDLVSRFLPDKLRKPTAAFVHAASAFVCACLAYAAYKFTLGEKEAGSMLVPGVPNYWAVCIIPIGFGLMTLRFALKIVTDIR